MLKANWYKHKLIFTQNRGTSRGVLQSKPAYFIVLKNVESDGYGIGECGLLPGLSIDDRQGYEEKLQQVILAANGASEFPDLTEWPSIKCGLEMAEMHLAQNSFKLFDTSFSSGNEGIAINGLIWMSDAGTMKKELEQKIASGFNCIKIKIGAIDFEEELKLLRYVRERFSAKEVALRVDANGAFSVNNAIEKLEKLALFDLHSIEQPIKAGQWQEMAALCEKSPIPIALDEELIGIFSSEKKKALISTIKPQAIILKPSLIGGFADCDEWIKLAEENACFWWATSALESNVGLNAIAQYTASKNPIIPQGLGTGQLYSNNFESPLEIKKTSCTTVNILIGKYLFFNEPFSGL